MAIVAVAAGVVLVLVILGDGFETIILPRGLTSTVRLTRAFFAGTWTVWSALARRFKSPDRREAVLSYFGPLSLLLLFIAWGIGMILGFALIQWGVSGGRPGFGTDLYFSGTTFITLGLGDVRPHTGFARAFVVVEAGVGLGFLAIVIGYLPVIYQAFSGREIAISLLDARAGSPPTAAELLKRQGAADDGAALNRLLADWEHRCAELLESHLSYPVLCYYRSQHDRQSWIAAMTAILDASALVMSGIENVPPFQARLTFAMARHAIVDLAAIFASSPTTVVPDRLPPEELARLQGFLAQARVHLVATPEAEGRLRELRALYEPYILRLAHWLAFAVPPFIEAAASHDAWETTAFHRNAQH